VTDAILAPVILLVIVGAAVHQWVLDAPLFELGTASWFPTGGELPAATAIARNALAGAVPLLASVVAAVLVVTTPVRVWLWGVVGLLAVTVALSPVFAVYHYRVRPPSAEERTVLDGLPDLDCRVLVITETRDGPVNGYAIGGPFRDVVGISEFALAALPPDQVAALLAHEVCHHRERHVLVRGGVSVLVLAAGAWVTTALVDGLGPLLAVSLLATVIAERLVAYWVMRRLEYRADAAAARHTSVEATVSLLDVLDDATDVDQSRISWPLWLFSTHPTYAARIERLRSRGVTQHDDRTTTPLPPQ